MANKLHTDSLSVPLDGATAANVDVDCGTGHLTIDELSGGQHVLAAGELQYFERQGIPSRSVDSDRGRATLALRARRGGQPAPWFRLPWAACAGATDWRIHLNPTVPAGIRAHSDGGNVRLNLAGAAVTHLEADSGGGNLELVLPEHAADLSVAAKTGGGNVTVDVGRGSTGRTTVDARSGAGNVVVRVPHGLAAKVEATSGLGKVTAPPGFSKVGDHSFQSPDYDAAADRVEITARSGAGNVRIETP